MGRFERLMILTTRLWFMTRSHLHDPGRTARWLYLNSRYAVGRILRRALGSFLRWAENQAAGPSVLRDVDRRVVEQLMPSLKSVSALGKFDFAVEAHIKGRFAELPIIRSGEWHSYAFHRFERHEALFERQYRFLICLPWLCAGGAERVAANLVHAISGLHGPESVAVLVLDYTPAWVRKRYPDDFPIRSWFPSEVPVVDLSGTADIDRNLRVEALANILLTIAPEMVINVNSQTMWECYLRHGRQLSRHIRLGACLFCNDYVVCDAPAGYAVTYFRDVLPVLESVISDQQHFLDELKQRYGLVSNEAAKLRCLYQPTAPGLRPVGEVARYERLSRPQAYRRQVLWTGRVTRQKNPELLIELARRNPSYDFHVYGTRERFYRFPRLPNLLIHGAFRTFDEIPHEKFDLLLYTSLWDGLPNVLLEAGERRLPIIAPMVGGIGDLVTEATGWPITKSDDVTAFSDALRQVSFEFERGGHGRIDEMHKLIRSRHSVEAFTRGVSLLVEGETIECQQLGAS